MLIFRYVVASLALCPSLAFGQSTFMLREVTTPGKSYKVETRTDVSGTLTISAQNEKSPQTVKLTGRSSVEYDERTLAALSDGSARSIRFYRAADFRRVVADRAQESGMRSTIRRMVVLRLGTREVPFSPDGPLTFGEIDLVRTDVFTPALAGLLPGQSVAVNDRWPAVLSAVEELTDMDRIEHGGLECQLVSVAGRTALVRFSGMVRGLNEDGPTQQQLHGSCTFDLDSNMIVGLELTGIKALLDGQGQQMGKIEGKFTLNRRPIPIAAELADAAIHGLQLEPNSTNTWLVYEGSVAGVRFNYPRRWRVSVEQGAQISLNDPSGNGIFITASPIEKLPTPASYQRENEDFFAKQKGKVLRVDPPQRVAATAGDCTRFGMDVELAGKRLRMEYFVVKQSAGGVTLAATLVPNEAGSLRPELEKLAAGILIGTVNPTGVKPIASK